MKIATFGDFHLGVTTYGTIDSNTGLNTRVLNALESLDYMINYCIDNNVEYVIFAGDMYKNNLPSPTLQRELNLRIKRAAEQNIKFFIMSGNHDVSPLETAKCPMDPFGTLKVNNINHSRFEKEYMIEDNLRILMLPTYCTQSEIEEILSRYDDNIRTIVVGHLTVLGAHLNDWLLEKSENAINVNIFNNKNILSVVLGHLHKHQILSGNPLVYYTGSLQRIDFTEEFQEKGFVVLDINDNDVDYEFIEVESQKFFTIKRDLRNDINEMDAITEVIEDNKENIKDSIFRLILTLNKNNNINDDLIIKQLKSFGVKSIAAIQKITDRQDMIRNAELTELLTEEKALELYFKTNENKKEIIDIGLKMIKELKDLNKI